MIWIPLLPVPARPQAKVGGSTLPSLLITIPSWSSRQETIHLEQLHHHHHQFCLVHPQRTGGVHQVQTSTFMFPF